MPVGNGVVLVGHERAHLAPGDHPGRHGAVRRRAPPSRVIVAGMPKLRAAMHLDTVFTFVDRDIVTLYPTIMDAVHTFTLLPVRHGAGRRGASTRASTPFVDVVARALGLPSIQVIDTGGDVYQSERQQWDSGNNAVALEPGVVFTYDRNTLTNTLLRKAGRRGHHDRRRRARPRPRRRALHDLSRSSATPWTSDSAAVSGYDQEPARRKPGRFAGQGAGRGLSEPPRPSSCRTSFCGAQNR